MKIALFWSFSVCEGLLRDIRCGRTPKKCGNNFFSGRGLPFPVNIIAPRPRTSTHCRARLRPRRSCPLVVPPRAPRGRAHLSCGMAVGRDVPIASPRHRRGAWLGIPRPRCAYPSCDSRPTAHYPLVMRMSLRTQNSHRHYARTLPGRRDGDIAPYRRYTRKIRTPLPTRHRPWGLPTPWRFATDDRDSGIDRKAGTKTAPAFLM